MSVCLVSSEGVWLLVDAEAAFLSSAIKSRIERQKGEEVEIQLPEVDHDVLEEIVEFCTHHVADPMNVIEKPLRCHELTSLVQPWYVDFVVRKEPPALTRLLFAAHHLDVAPLIDLLCFRMATLIKDKNRQEVAGFFEKSGVRLSAEQLQDVDIA